MYVEKGAEFSRAIVPNNKSQLLLYLLEEPQPHLLLAAPFGIIRTLAPMINGAIPLTRHHTIYIRILDCCCWELKGNCSLQTIGNNFIQFAIYFKRQLYLQGELHIWNVFFISCFWYDILVDKNKCFKSVK